MEEISLKIGEISNYLVNDILQLNQVTNLSKMLQQMSVDCVENIFHWSIHRPIRSPEQIFVPSDCDPVEKDLIVVNVEIIHCKTEGSVGVVVF